LPFVWLFACPVVGSSLFSSSMRLLACLPDAEFVRCGQAVALSQQAQEVDLPAAADGPDRPDLTGGRGTGAGLVAEDGTVGHRLLGTVGPVRVGTVGRDPCAADGRAGADLDDLLRLGDLMGVSRALAGQPGDLVLDSLLRSPRCRSRGCCRVRPRWCRRPRRWSSRAGRLSWRRRHGVSAWGWVPVGWLGWG